MFGRANTNSTLPRGAMVIGSLSGTSHSPPLHHQKPATGAEHAQHSQKVEAARETYAKDVGATSLADTLGKSSCCQKARDKLQADLAALESARQSDNSTSTQAANDAYAQNGPDDAATAADTNDAGRETQS